MVIEVKRQRLAELLAALRGDASQNVMAERLGFSRGKWQRWEALNGFPDWDEIEVICEHLGWSMQTFKDYLDGHFALGKDMSKPGMRNQRSTDAVKVVTADQIKTAIQSLGPEDVVQILHVATDRLGDLSCHNGQSPPS